MSKYFPKEINDAMWEFFLKTSIPRLVEKKRKEAKENEELHK